MQTKPPAWLWFLVAAFGLGWILIGLVCVGAMTGMNRRAKALNTVDAGNPQAAPPLQTAAAPVAACRLGNGDAAAVWVFPTEAGLKEWAQGGETTAKEAVRHGGRIVARGTRCAFVDAGFVRSQIRITEGPNEGLSGWTETEWTRLQE